MSPAEFNQRLGLRLPKTVNATKKAAVDVDSLPSSVDWRNEGAVNPVKNQGSCGSCWAFSAVGALEGAYAISHGQLLQFSEQQLVDCSRDDDDEEGNQGCDGGWMDNAFEYARHNALESEQDYKYTASDDVCSYDASKGIVTVHKFVRLPENNGDAILEAASRQPVSVAVNAGSLGW